MARDWNGDWVREPEPDSDCPYDEWPDDDGYMLGAHLDDDAPPPPGPDGKKYSPL
jgi:hypothetical protein